VTAVKPQFAVGDSIYVSAIREGGKRVILERPHLGSVCAVSGAEDRLLIVIFNPTHSTSSSWEYALPEDCEVVR